MTNHTEVLNYIIEKKGYKSFLEIGTQNGRNFHALNCAHKVGVDPDQLARPTHRMTSDEFFSQNKETFDCVFIDGLHTAEQVQKDFINAMACLNEGGAVVMHDTNPEKEEWTKIPRVTKQWTGDVWQFVVCLLADFKTLPFDYGITVVKKGNHTITDFPHDFISPWEEFNRDRNSILKIVSVDQFKEWL